MCITQNDDEKRRSTPITLPSINIYIYIITHARVRAFALYIPEHYYYIYFDLIIIIIITKIIVNYFVE